MSPWQVREAQQQPALSPISRKAGNRFGTTCAAKACRAYGESEGEAKLSQSWHRRKSLQLQAGCAPLVASNRRADRPQLTKLVAFRAESRIRGPTKRRVTDCDVHLRWRRRLWFWGRRGKRVRLGNVLAHVNQKRTRRHLVCQLRNTVQPRWSRRPQTRRFRNWVMSLQQPRGYSCSVHHLPASRVSKSQVLTCMLHSCLVHEDESAAVPASWAPLGEQQAVADASLETGQVRATTSEDNYHTAVRLHLG